MFVTKRRLFSCNGKRSIYMALYLLLALSCLPVETLCESCNDHSLVQLQQYHSTSGTDNALDTYVYVRCVRCVYISGTGCLIVMNFDK